MRDFSSCRHDPKQVNENPASVVGAGRRRVNGNVALPVSSVPGPGPPSGPASGSKVPLICIVYCVESTRNVTVGYRPVTKTGEGNWTQPVSLLVA